MHRLPGIELCNGKVVNFREPKSQSQFLVCLECHLNDRQLGKINLYEDPSDFPPWAKTKDGSEDRYCFGAVQIIKTDTGEKIKLRTKVMLNFQFSDGTFNPEEVEEYCMPYNRAGVIMLLKHEIMVRIDMNRINVKHKKELKKAIADNEKPNIIMGFLNNLNFNWVGNIEFPWNNKK